MNPIRKIKSHPNYKWVIVASCFLMVMICLGFCSGVKSLYLAAITKELGIERSLFSFNDSARYIATAIINLFFGTLVMRFGPRKMIAAGFACLIGSMLIYSFAQALYVFYIGGAMLGVGLAWTTTTMVGYVVNQWCKEKKGTIMGAVLAANGLGGAAAAQIVDPIINGEPFGYRTAYRVTAIILVVVAVVVVTLFKNEPDGAERAAHGKKKAKGKSWSGLTLNQCLRTPYFYAAALCIFLTGMVLQGTNGIYPAHMRDVGLGVYAATAVSVHSLVLTACKFLSGVSFDKLGLRVTMIICDLAAIVFIFLLAGLHSGSSFTVALLVGILSSVALPLETIMLPLIASDLFGEKEYAKIMGIVVSINTAGYALGAPLVNWFYDNQGTYANGLKIMVVVMIAITIGFQVVISVAHKYRNRIAEQEAALEESTNNN